MSDEVILSLPEQEDLVDHLLAWHGITTPGGWDFPLTDEQEQELADRHRHRHRINSALHRHAHRGMTHL